MFGKDNFERKARNRQIWGLARLLQLDSKDLQSEWKIIRRLSSDLSSQAAMIDLATAPKKIAMFPLMSKAVRLLLLLSLGIATVETREILFSHEEDCFESSKPS